MSLSNLQHAQMLHEAGKQMPGSCCAFREHWDEVSEHRGPQWDWRSQKWPEQVRLSNLQHARMLHEAGKTNAWLWVFNPRDCETLVWALWTANMMGCCRQSNKRKLKSYETWVLVTSNMRACYKDTWRDKCEPCGLQTWRNVAGRATPMSTAKGMMSNRPEQLISCVHD